MKTILLDSNSLAYRAHYAMSATGKVLTNREGQPTGAIHAFFTMLLKLIADEKPTHLAAAFDLHAPTFRHTLYAPYKGTRKPMPDELVSQMPIIKRLLKLMHVPVFELEGYEADDILGTLAKRFDQTTLIVTGDKDSFQLIDDSTAVLYTKQGMTNIEKYDLAHLFEVEGLTPQAFIDYKALRGDTSDNIPGIAGIGDKTAKQLLAQFGTLEGVLSGYSQLKGALREKIERGREVAELSKILATINVEVPISCTLEQLAYDGGYSPELFSELSALELTAVQRRLTAIGSTTAEIAKKPIAESVTLTELSEVKSVLKSAKAVALLYGESVRFACDGDTEYLISPTVDLFGGLDYIEVLQAVLADCKDKQVYVYDLKKLLHHAEACRATVPKNCFDTMIAAHLTLGSRTMKGVEDCLATYGYEPSAAGLFAVSEQLKRELKSKRLESLYYELEYPLVFVLRDMENAGFAVDTNVLDELNEKYTAELNALTQEIYLLAGGEFNLNSTKQMGELLFERLGLRHGKKTKTGYSVDSAVLENLVYDHPIIAPILRYRKLAKLKSTYVDGLIPLVKKDGKIHTVFNQCITATGRLSSTEPNLQNIPTRTAEGKELRRAFCSSEGCVLVSADYSQIELRLLAHFSGDEELVKAYRGDEDIHRLTASKIFGVSPENVTSEMRSNAKAVNFGIIYGISSFGLANNISIPNYKAREFIERYFESHPAVKQYMEQNVAFANENGYVNTLLGRIRVIPELLSSNHNTRSFGERVAMNMPLQGTAADIVKVAMLGVARRLSGMRSKLILQVHDELLIDAYEPEAEQVAEILREEMENAAQLRVPLVANVARGKIWYDAK